MNSALLFVLTMLNYNRVYDIISKHLILIGCSYITVSFYIKLLEQYSATMKSCFIRFS